MGPNVPPNDDVAFHGFQPGDCNILFYQLPIVVGGLFGHLEEG